MPSDDDPEGVRRIRPAVAIDKLGPHHSRQLFRDTLAATKHPNNGALPIEWAGTVEPVLDGLWLVDDLLPSHGVAVLYGHPGSGKSFLALDIGMRVALGWDVAGRRVRQGLVLYLCAEGQTGFRNRLSAFRRHYDIPEDTPFAFVPVAIDLQSPDGDREKLIRAVRDTSEVIGAIPSLVIVDTLSKTFGVGKENTDDMAVYVANCAAVSDALNLCTLVIHHRPKDSESRDLRGHSSLRGGVETTILVEGGKVKTAETLKQKDGPDHERIAFTLDLFELGTNRDGKEITTCLVNYCGAGTYVPESPIKRAIAKLSDHQKIILRSIGDAIAEHGVGIGAPVPSSEYNAITTGKMVLTGQASDRCKEALLACSEGDADKRRDNVTRSWNRNLPKLKDKKIIGSWGDWLWINY